MKKAEKKEKKRRRRPKKGETRLPQPESKLEKQVKQTAVESIKKLDTAWLVRVQKEQPG